MTENLFSHQLHVIRWSKTCIRVVKLEYSTKWSMFHNWWSLWGLHVILLTTSISKPSPTYFSARAPKYFFLSFYAVVHNVYSSGTQVYCREYGKSITQMGHRKLWFWTWKRPLSKHWQSLIKGMAKENGEFCAFANWYFEEPSVIICL